ncbi:hypothetical protein [Nonomuraea guangzhouensis]|uniref:Histidine kinase/HSP90-like ATPase domain-containing protein n=1 Tax=Nonomuraea guangzhouensis TaxID=1291555 RepID=A0ABW4GZW4_9ACTN|nr:hypothetical protein [Nonomuraea guangzhouensis]
MIRDFESVSRTFSQALEDQLAEWSLRTGITVEVWALPKQPLRALVTEIVHGLIFDVLEEVERQGRARAVSIALTVASSGLRLTVSDDGLGRSAAAYEDHLSSRRAELARMNSGLTVSDDGLGRSAAAYEDHLSSRRAELARMNGGLTVNGVPGEGTTVSAAIPRRALGNPGPEQRLSKDAGRSRQASEPVVSIRDAT